MLRYLKFYGDRGIQIARAKDQYVWDEQGRRYLDYHTGHGVAFLGHCNPHVTEAVIEQMRTLQVASTSFGVRIRDEMLDALSKITPSHLEYVTLLNSGSEAVEFSLKLARRVTGRKVFVAFTGSFHGRTMGALSVTWNPKHRMPFEPLVPEVRFCRFNSTEQVIELIREDTAAVIMEVVQGEGGINIASKEFVREVEKRVREAGSLLIIDEIQSGFGRTGSVWAHERYGVKPDIMLAGKALGGGFPVSAVFVTSEVAGKLGPGEHGSTYGGNPLACAAVKAASEVLVKDNVAGKAAERGRELLGMLQEKLGENRIVRDVRGAGLMIGVELRLNPSYVIKRAQEEGLLTLKAGATVVRLLPPYLITRNDVEWSVNVLCKCIGELNSRTPVQATQGV